MKEDGDDLGGMSSRYSNCGYRIYMSGFYTKDGLYVYQTRMGKEHRGIMSQERLLRSCPNGDRIWIGDVGDVGDDQWRWSLNGLWLQLLCCAHNRYGPLFQSRDKGRRSWLNRHEFK